MTRYLELPNSALSDTTCLLSPGFLGYLLLLRGSPLPQGSGEVDEWKLFFVKALTQILETQLLHKSTPINLAVASSFGLGIPSSHFVNHIFQLCNRNFMRSRQLADQLGTTQERYYTREKCLRFPILRSRILFTKSIDLFKCSKVNDGRFWYSF